MKAEDSNRPVAVILYGMVAVGKLTVAKALQQELGYRLTHNHLINDLVWSIFEPRTLDGNQLIEKLRYELYEEAARHGVSVIITHAYSHAYVSPTGLSDPDYMRALETKLEAAGADTFFVHLQADRETLIERVQGESRREHRKLTDVSTLMEYLGGKNDLDVTTPAPVRNNLVIDTTDLTVEETAKRIAEEVRKRS
jgi:shikimate kinase